MESTKRLFLDGQRTSYRHHNQQIGRDEDQQSATTLKMGEHQPVANTLALTLPVPERLANVDDYIAFFEKSGLTYNYNMSRCDNILRVLNRLDARYPAVIDGLIFEINERVTYQLPAWLTLENCSIIGQGTIEFFKWAEGT